MNIPNENGTLKYIVNSSENCTHYTILNKFPLCYNLNKIIFLSNTEFLRKNLPDQKKNIKRICHVVVDKKKVNNSKRLM